MKKTVFTTIVLFCSLSAFSQRYTTQTYDDPVSAYDTTFLQKQMESRQYYYNQNYKIIKSKVDRINSIVKYLFENYVLSDNQIKYIQNYQKEVTKFKEYDLSRVKVAEQILEYLEEIDNTLISWTE